MDIEVQKCRRINITQNTDRGKIFTTKNSTEGFLEFESLGEESLFLLLDHDPNCIAVESQPLRIQNEESKNIYYTPDAFAEFRDGIKCIFDVKFHTFFEELIVDQGKRKLWEDRIIILQNYCTKMNFQYYIITERELRSPRLENVIFFRKNKRVPQGLNRIREKIKSRCSELNPITRLQMIKELTRLMKINKDYLIAVIDYLIFHDFFDLDFEALITDNSELKLRKENNPSTIKPLYQYFSQIQSQTSLKPTLNNFTLNPISFENITQEINALPKKYQDLVQSRINHINKFKQFDRNSKELTEYLESNKIARSTLYRWKKCYELYGWNGLVPRFDKRGKKQGEAKLREKLIEQILNDKFQTTNQPSIAGAYNFLILACEQNQIDPCSYETFRRRVARISMKQKILKRNGKRAQKELFKGLNGTFPFGTHPLDLVEIDHNTVDLFVVDRLERKCIGKPFLTVAIDVYSRMIYGYYLSLDEPSALSIGMCFLCGINKKDQITQHFQTKNTWPIFGLPKRIMSDNGMEFRGDSYLNFCHQFDIEMIFNPPKQPEKKPHIERFFRTLSNAIKDDLIEGYKHPLENRKKSHTNPEERAVMTLDEFENWLIHWIVDYYHQKDHAGLKEKEGELISPNERYLSSTKGSNNRTAGKPVLPLSIDQLHFDVLIFEQRLIQRGGFRLFGLEYSSPVINTLLANQKTRKQKYILRYDPRDIREIYVWWDDQKKYVPIPIKESYYKFLQINPQQKDDIPLSKRELNVIKKNHNNHFPLSNAEISDALSTRQKILESSCINSKNVKSQRKRREKLQSNKEKSTASVIRTQQTSNQIEKVQELNENDSLKKTNKRSFPIKIFFEE